jgi:hypothetical protein
MDPLKNGANLGSEISLEYLSLSHIKFVKIICVHSDKLHKHRCFHFVALKRTK